MKYIVTMLAPVTNGEGLHEICTMDFPSSQKPTKWDASETARYKSAFKKYIPKDHALIGKIEVAEFRDA